MNPWPYILAGYLLTAVSVLVYLFSLGRRKRAVKTQCDALRRQEEDTTR